MSRLRIRLRSLWISVFACAAAALVACSSSSGGSGTATGACADYVAALTEGGKACGRAVVAPGREAELSSRLGQLCTYTVNAPGSGITPALLDQCSAKVRAGCGDDDACEDIENSGTLPDGAPCGADTQCAGGDCKTPLPGAGCGTCAARVPVGGSCSNDKPCVRSATCETKTGTSGTCVARVKLAQGEVCFDPSKPSASGISSCAEGLTCKVESSGSGPVTCTPRGAAGATCTSESDCLSQLACVNGTCGNPGPIGTACTSSSQCADGVCSQATRKCVGVTWVESGGGCDGSERRCTRGSCSRSGSSTGTGGTVPEGKCVDPLPDGAPCSLVSSEAAARCDSYASCVNGTCQIFDPSTCK